MKWQQRWPWPAQPRPKRTWRPLNRRSVWRIPATPSAWPTTRDARSMRWQRDQRWSRNWRRRVPPKHQLLLQVVFMFGHRTLLDFFRHTSCFTHSWGSPQAPEKLSPKNAAQPQLTACVRLRGACEKHAAPGAVTRPLSHPLAPCRRTSRPLPSCSWRPSAP